MADTRAAGTPGEVSAVTAQLGRYMSEAALTKLPPDVAAKAGMHVLDTLGAMISGSRLDAGRAASAFAARFVSAGGATVVGAPFLATLPEAALANGMMGHADETDDSHLGGRFHPGCGIVPAALALAEAEGRSGEDLLRAVVLGYDVGARVTMALGLRPPSQARHSTHSLGATFGAAADAALLLRPTPEQARHVLSYAAQQASGVPFWQRDSRHVEKAFDFGGMGARNGVTAALLVASGCSAVDDPFAGAQSLFTAFADEASPGLLSDGLGSRFEIMAASLKKWSVGSPIQSVLDAMQALVREHRLRPDDVTTITVHMPDDRLHIVDNRDMPDVCLQHLLALMLQDGDVSFATGHDYGRMSDPVLLAIRRRIRVVSSRALTEAMPARQSIVELATADGRALRYHARSVRGTPENPMSENELVAKFLALAVPVIGEAKAERLVALSGAFGDLVSVTELRPLLQAA
ncbi:MAG: MmgE/PrpD family protein [Janthinobacterium lividum]